MEGAVGSHHQPTNQRERISEISRLLREAQQICRKASKDGAHKERHTRQLFETIATLLDDVLAVLGRHERQQPPERTLH